VHAVVEKSGITVRAFFGEIEGDRALRVKRSGSEAEAVVQAVFDELVDRGAMELLKSTAGEQR